MRTLNLNGYIDEEVWYGDEITPAMLHDALYGENEEFSDDVCIILNSYGGSCNAATRMHDDIRAYPGKVHLVISGTAASAATVLSMAADTLEMTPGSLYMIHDPSTFAWGNERNFNEAIMLLRACKESILNIYACRCPLERSTVSAMMTATTWMDAGSALAHGFIDAVADPQSSPSNSARAHVINRKDAEAKVQMWLDRHNPQTPRPTPGMRNCETPVIVQTVPETEHAQAEAEVPTVEPETQEPGVPADQLHKRLNLIKPNDR